jgi:hypothetical protein
LTLGGSGHNGILRVVQRLDSTANADTVLGKKLDELRNKSRYLLALLFLEAKIAK